MWVHKEMTASYGFLMRRMALPSPKARFDALKGHVHMTFV